MAQICSHCAAEIPATAKFCPDCGAPALAPCPNCGVVPLKPQQRFCIECGGPLTAAQPAVAPAEPYSRSSTESSPIIAPEPDARASIRERRLVSVLFADLVGFTTYSEGRDPEDVLALMSEYFAAARRIVVSYGGIVQKFIGDAVMAVWGSPVAHEDDAERAVRAGLDLVTAVTALGDRVGVEMRLRVGILTGETAVQMDAVHEGMVIGDAVNTASRIESLALPGTVLVDDVTRLVTERAILYENEGIHEVKGKTELVQIWRAVRVVATVGGEIKGGFEPPLVGRNQQLGLLKDELINLLEPDAEFGLAVVFGEAGSGKSRLAWEFQKFADGLAADVHWHQGRCVSFGEGVGFRAVADMVRMRADIVLDDPVDQQRVKLAAMLDELFATDRDSYERADRTLARLLGLDDGKRLISQGELFAGWRLFFERLSEAAPVILLFEDLHWSDQGQLDFIDHLVDWSKDKRILVVGLSRPDARVEALALHAVRIELGTLTDPEMREIITNTVIDAPVELVDRVCEHAGGIALYAVETLRVLIDRGALVPDGDYYRLVDRVEELDVPPSIHALIAARLDTLGQLERRALLDGSVLGQRFTVSSVAALTHMPEQDTRVLLDGLVAKHFLTVERDPHSPDRGQYVFVHALVHRVAFGTISKHSRKELHLGAVEYLNANAHDADVAPIIAGHLLEAAQLETNAADVEVIKGRARMALRQAAIRAEAVGALNEALDLYDRLAAAETNEHRRAEMLEHAGSIAERASDARIAAQRYSSAASLRDQLGEHREALRLRALELRAQVYWRSATDQLESARELYDQLSDQKDGAFALAASHFAFTLYQSDQPAESAEIAQEAVKAAKRSEDPVILERALTAHSAALTDLGMLNEAVALDRTVLAIAREHEPARVATLGLNMAISLGALGRFSEAAQAARDAITAAERIGDRFGQVVSALQLSRVLVMLGEWDQALAAINEVKGKVPPFNLGMMITAPLMIAMRRGQSDRSSDILSDFERRSGDAAVGSADYRCLVETVNATRDSNPQQAADTVVNAEIADYAEFNGWVPLAVDLIVRHADGEVLSQALAALRDTGELATAPPIVSQIERLSAHLALRAGDNVQANKHWRAAQKISDDSGMVFEAAVLDLELAENSLANSGAYDMLKRARTTFMELGATPWLRRTVAVIETHERDRLAG